MNFFPKTQLTKTSTSRQNTNNTDEVRLHAMTLHHSKKINGFLILLILSTTRNHCTPNHYILVGYLMKQFPHNFHIKHRIKPKKGRQNWNFLLKPHFNHITMSHPYAIMGTECTQCTNYSQGSHEVWLLVIQEH
uniref:Uncharacterized protein n=1 Tax=Rhizophora mucronata TaxID=61149 RepID=A0A2P2INF0_RHIMU